MLLWHKSQGWFYPTNSLISMSPSHTWLKFSISIADIAQKGIWFLVLCKPEGSSIPCVLEFNCVFGLLCMSTNIKVDLLVIFGTYLGQGVLWLQGVTIVVTSCSLICSILLRVLSGNSQRWSSNQCFSHVLRLHPVVTWYHSASYFAMMVRNS